MMGFRHHALLAAIALLCIAMETASGRLTLQLKGRSIPNDGSGHVLITDVGSDNSNALLCKSTSSNCCYGGHTNWYYKYGSSGEHRIESDDPAYGWKRNRGHNPGVVRLRARKSVSLPGDCREGIYACVVTGVDVISVSLYYRVHVRLSFQMSPLSLVPSSSPSTPSFVITCTSTGGTVLTSSLTGPGGVLLGRLSGVGQLRGRGLDTYRLNVARGNGSHGDTYRCTASNGASIETRSYVISAALPATNLSTQQLAPSVLLLRWSQPLGGARVQSYIVTGFYGNGVVAAYTTLKSTQREVTLTRLVNDGREYTFIVTATSNHLPGSATIKTRLGRIDTPKLTTVSIGTTSALISWPSHSPTGVRSYKLVYARLTGSQQLEECPDYSDNGTIFIDASESSHLLGGLEEASMYGVKCQALSSVLGDSVMSDVLHFTTLEAAPSTPPTDPTVSFISSSSLCLNWGPVNSCININGNSTGWQVIYSPTNSSLTKGNTTINVPGSPLKSGHTCIEGLRAYTEYVLHIAAVNSGQKVGAASECVYARTLESVPGPVTLLTETFQNMTNIAVSWQEPTSPGGIIIAYEVSYWAVEDPKMVSKATNISGGEMSVFISVPLDVKPGSKVVFSVRAFTRVGSGPAKNMSVQIIQFEDEEDKQLFSARLVSADTVNVSWCDPTDVAGGNVTFHLVHQLVSSNQIVRWEARQSYDAETIFALIPLKKKEKRDEGEEEGKGEEEEEEEEVEGEHRYFLTYTWSVQGEKYKSKTMNTSLKIDRALFQVQIGPVDHCITWTDNKARRIEHLIHIAIGNAIHHSYPSSSSCFLRKGLFLCHSNPTMATYRTTLLAPSTPALHDATKLVGVIKSWVNEGPSLVLDWLLVKFNRDCPVSVPFISAPENVLGTNGSSLSSFPLSSELVKVCMTQLERICDGRTDAP